MSVAENILTMQKRITDIANTTAQSNQNVTLLAVSKTKPVSAIEDAILAGQRLFGENYVQEGVEKIVYFREHMASIPLEWHFIGPLQSNKTKLVAEHFDWVQTIDRIKIAARLHEQRPAHLANLNVLIQVNISDEESKSGIPLSELTELAEQLRQYPRLTLRGLMAIPAPEADHDKQLAIFAQMKAAFDQLQQDYLSVDTLSMGMSDDMEAAITAGSTMIRIGTAIFGARNYNKSPQ